MNKIGIYLKISKKIQKPIDKPLQDMYNKFRMILKAEVLMTKQKATVLEVIRRDKCHHTAEEIFILASEELPGISRATVYNNLKALEKDKLIRRITAEDTSDRYDGAYIPHGHLFCKICGGVRDFEIPDFTERLSEYTGGSMDSYELKVRYVCPECVNK